MDNQDAREQFDLMVTFNKRTNASVYERLTFSVLLFRGHKADKPFDVSLRGLARDTGIEDPLDVATMLHSLAKMGCIVLSESTQSKPNAPHVLVQITTPDQWHTINRELVTGGDAQ